MFVRDGILLSITTCQTRYFIHLLTSLPKSTPTFPAFTEAALEAEGQTGSKGS